MKNSDLYRPCVGITLFNAAGLVFVGERIDTPGAWQMPQGGVDEGENIETASRRELREEIGTDKAEIIRIHDQILRYDLPPDVRARIPWGNKYAGQDQTWVAMRFTGTDSDIKLDADDHPEFSQYKWIPLADVTKLIVPFKIETYEHVVKAFADIA